MAIEIERKWLLTDVPPMDVLRQFESVVHLDQGYLPGEVIHERVTKRIRESFITGLASKVSFVRAVKIGNGIERQEFQERISPEMFERVWPLTFGRRIEKTRYAVPDGRTQLQWEIDVFADRKLCIAEVELPDVTAPVTLPLWLQPFIDHEVTGDARYEGFYLGK